MKTQKTQTFWKVVFVAIFGTLAFIEASSVYSQLSSLELLILGLACVRMARTISFNGVGEPFRKPFTEVVPDSCGAGDNVCPRGTGLRYVIGDLIACPICSGAWSALVLLAVWSWKPGIVNVLAVAGLSEVFNWAIDLLKWRGRQTRCMSGLISPDKK